MAKYRHRTFEMFDFFEEAASELSSRSTRQKPDSDDLSSWTFQHLDVSCTGIVVHVKFKAKIGFDSPDSAELRSDFSQLAESLLNDSRVLLDFSGLNQFDAKPIEELKRLNSMLQSKGSRMVLCNLEPTARATFFPQRTGNDHKSSSVN